MNISPTQVLKDAWGLTKKNAKVILLAYVFLFGFYILQAILQQIIFFSVGENSGLFVTLNLAISIVFTVLTIIIQIGMIRYFLKVIDGGKPELKDLYQFPNMPMRTLNLFISSIIFGIAFVIGLILLIIPGIYVGLKYQFYSEFIADKDSGILDSLKLSGVATKGKLMSLFGFVLLLIGVNILGVLLLFVGLLVTIPLSYMAYLLMYRRLSAVSLPAKA